MGPGPSPVLGPEKISLYLEYGPNWKSELLHDIHDSCGDLFTYPVFCRDGVFWTSKLLLASVSKMMEEAISSSHPESCLVIPDLSKHDLLQFYSAAFTGSLDTERMRSINNVASTLALHHLHQSGVRSHWEDEEEEEEEDVSSGVKCLKKSDKIKLSHYFQHWSEGPPSHGSPASLETQLKQFNGSPVECSDCGRKFGGLRHLERHRASVHRQIGVLSLVHIVQIVCSLTMLAPRSMV